MNDEKDKKIKGTGEPKEAKGTDGAQRKLEPKTFLPKKGNYRGLLVYQKAECLYDITFYFAHHYFVERKDRTIDQVVQAARSGKQNIAEGCAAASTSAETELKLLGVARASMQETLLDYEDYLRTRHLEQWTVDDPRTQQIQEYSKSHNRPEDYTKDIEKRSPEALCNIAITLIHQFDNMMGRLIDRLQKDFVENGGIREQMTAARLGYRNEQKARIAELESENTGLKARIAELERKVKELMRQIGPMSLIGLIGPMGLMGLMRLIGRMGLMGLIGLVGLIGPMGLMGCSGGGGDQAVDTPPPTPPTPTTPTTTEVAISFSGHEEEGKTVEQGGNRANGANGTNRTNEANRAYGQLASRRAGTPLSQSAQAFTVWGYKNMSESAGDYGGLQTVFPGYTVKWINGSASSTSSNTSGWEYVAQQTGSDPEQTIKYWDMSAKAYRYFAVTGNVVEDNNGSYEANKAYKKATEPNGPYEFTMVANASPVREGEGTAEQKIAANMAEAPFFSHLWFSTGNVSTYPDKQFGKPVTLEFLKPFARVRFMFNYSYVAEGVKVTSPSFKPTADIGADEENKVKIARKGTVKVTYPLTGTATTESYTVTVDDDKSTRLDAFTEEYIPEGTEKWYVVLPVASQGSYTMTVSVNGTQKTAVVPAQYMSWKPGYSYTYIFKITEEGGVVVDLVQTAVTPWTDMTIVHSVYNW